MVVGLELNLRHCHKLTFQPLHLLTAYTKRWFMNHCPVQVTRVMLSGSQDFALILHV
jgi:hypothetical protein